MRNAEFRIPDPGSPDSAGSLGLEFEAFLSSVRIPHSAFRISRLAMAGNVVLSQEKASSGRLAPALRAVSAAALFDGHDAAVNLMRRLLQAEGAEVIHLGHNRSAAEVAAAVVQEDAQAAVVSSYQGGHLEFYPYLRELLDRAGRGDVKIFAGGGGVILPREVEELEARGVAKVFTPEDGRRLGLRGMARFMIDGASGSLLDLPFPEGPLAVGGDLVIARAITLAEAGRNPRLPLRPGAEEGRSLTVGVTGTGGAGKSSLIDELVLRLGRDFPDLPVAVLANDPTKRKTGGALLGDRLRMNSIHRPGVYLRSLATRGSGTEVSVALLAAVEVLRLAGFPLVFVETSGIGQSSAGVLGLGGVSIYAMTADFGGPTQLEKIEMLEWADLIALNKSDRPGADDARREVARAVRRSRPSFDPQRVMATCASRFADAGVERLYRALAQLLLERGLAVSLPSWPEIPPEVQPARIIPLGREAYLFDAARAVRARHHAAEEQAEVMRGLESATRAADDLRKSGAGDEAVRAVEAVAARHQAALSPESRRLLADFEDDLAARRSGTLRYRVRDREREVALAAPSLAGTPVPRIAFPPTRDRAELLRFLWRENLPGRFPFTAGVFPVKRQEEESTRQFAGEGPPERTNRRFHLLCEGQSARRLSTAFDSPTLYGEDPGERPDIYGKIGESGVSVATIEDMRRLYAGFDLADSATSVSMTINGPAPAILAMFFNAAIDQAADRAAADRGRPVGEEERARLSREVLSRVRGTVQADILKEDQAQNTCIFSTAFALKMMADVQEYFILNEVRNYYSVSISGYHIAEAGANPITQLALTLANGLTYVEYYLSRGMALDRFAPSFSFFFSSGLDPEYAVLGRVARRIWSVVIRDRYGGNERSQKLKYHIQTSGRSLHSREISFNDIRTTLQALMAYHDQCNSLHTNAYDEAITTPTEESVRRALAIQLIIQEELGLARCENPLQGSALIEELTSLTEEAVLVEFERIAERGGVLGAMETGYIRNRIQEESLLYEQKKSSGELPIIGVNTFLAPSGGEAREVPAVRASREEKDLQVRRVGEFQERNRAQAAEALRRLAEVARSGKNIFAELMETVRWASLGQITHALYRVGGAFRRSL
jgi:isobutyryl-CoA mutase